MTAAAENGDGSDDGRFALLARHRMLVQGLADSLIWLAALTSATLLRFEFDLDQIEVERLVVLFVVAASVQFLTGLATGLYLGRWQYGSFEEVAALVKATFLALVVALIVNQIPDSVLVPTSAVMAAGAFTLVAQVAMRYVWRLVLERNRRPNRPDARRVVVAGAGFGGDQLIRAMVTNPASPYLPVALLDDDPAKARLGIKGVEMQGRLDDLCEVAAQQEADAVVLAIPSASAELVRELTAEAHRCDLQVFVLPPVDDLLDEGVAVSDVRPVSEADLLGRRVLDTDVAGIADYLKGRRVLVTGAGGSIGSELCRQIHRFSPASLIMLDRDESALHQVQLSIEGRAMLDRDDIVVADIRDADRLDEVLRHHRPHVVFHTAALKHLPLLEMHPDEAVKSNVWGTHNLLAAASSVHVDRFVNVSTDKAADPTSVLGYTKRLAEGLTAACDEQLGTYVSVRFGNVLGSRGSVLTAFRSQIEHGGPITVTDPEVTRYFMLIEEAVQLVIQAGALDAPDGAAMVLDMGEPVSIQAMAEALVAESGQDVEIVHTGLRPGEKLHEILIGRDEHAVPTTHELISMVGVPPVEAEHLRTSLAGRTDTHRALADVCAELCGQRDGPSSSSSPSALHPPATVTD